MEKKDKDKKPLPELSLAEEITLYEKFIDEFTDENCRMEQRTNPDAIFNWFANKLWRE